MFVAAAALAMPEASHGCSVPVFRYALEHWQPDPYVAVVFHRGELTERQQSLVEQLEPQGDTGNPIANIIVRTVDLDDDPGEVILDLWKQHETDTLPLLSLQTPPRLGPPQTVWHGELTDGNVAALTDSPVRRQINERLLAGDSVVWVFLESGKPETDDESFALLEQELSRLQETIELPPIDDADLSELTLDPEELKIAFSTIRLSRHQENERPLIEMLLRVERDLLDEPFVNQAMAFPVFGRGRALYALVGDGITDETIEEASRFLAGACQCTVKAQNPGVDLLMTVDWDQYVTPALPYDDSEPVLSGLTSFAATMPADETPASEPSASKPVSAASDSGEREPDQPPASAEAAGRETADASSADQVESDPSTDARPAPVTATQPPSGVDSLAQNIALLLGLIVAGVVLATLLIVLKSR